MPQLKLTAITPQHLPSTAEYLKAMEQGVLKSSQLVERDLRSTTRTWQNRPVFYIVIGKQGNDYTITAGTDNLIYKFVTGGTKAHVIKPKRSKYLSFQSGYRAKTRPQIIGSQDGGAFGDSVFAQSVQHPGTKARKFIETIQKRRQKTIEQEVSQAIAKINRTQK